MLRHLRSAAAGASGHAPPPPPPAPSEGDEEEDTARAIAVSDQRTIYLVNMFIANTVEFLNSFTALCNDKLSLLHRKIVKLDSSLTLLEAKLHSTDATDVLGHSTRVDTANLLGESSRMLLVQLNAFQNEPCHSNSYLMQKLFITPFNVSVNLSQLQVPQMHGRSGDYS